MKKFLLLLILTIMASCTKIETPFEKHEFGTSVKDFIGTEWLIATEDGSFVEGIVFDTSTTATFVLVNTNGNQSIHGTYKYLPSSRMFLFESDSWWVSKDGSIMTYETAKLINEKTIELCSKITKKDGSSKLYYDSLIRQ